MNWPHLILFLVGLLYATRCGILPTGLCPLFWKIPSSYERRSNNRPGSAA